MLPRSLPMLYLFAIGCSSNTEAFAPASEVPSASTEAQSAGSGQLTAGAWDDNRNYDYFVEYLAEHPQQGTLELREEERLQALALHGGERSAKEVLDIALVVDTTGSMGDEMTYLKDELDAIAAAITAEFPDAEQRYALIVYRDEGDDYVTRSFDFTADLTKLQRNLADQSADGGGDYPEASQAALAETAALSWRGGSTARLAFWVSDAPHHVQDAAELTDTVRALAAVDVHLYPIAASGVDELAELTMRSAAQLTGGRYLFLTDDSGLGDSHKEPTIPCYFVTKLDDALVRMAAIELSGVYREPDASDVIRTGGDPENGACTLEGGELVTVF